MLNAVDQLIQSLSGSKKSIFGKQWRNDDGTLQDSISADAITKGIPLAPAPCASTTIPVSTLDTLTYNKKELKYNYYPLLSDYSGGLDYFSNICVFVQVDLDPVMLNTNSVSDINIIIMI